MKDNTNRWYLLPGTGANFTMYDFIRKKLKFEINFINWPKYNGEKTYTEIAKRVIEESGIEDGDIVGGSSLGGMVALEIARQKKLKAVVLIGSALSPAEVQGILILLAPLAAITPVSFVQLLAGKYNNKITRMFAEADSELIRALCQYLPKWPGAKDLEVPIFRIHGQKDCIMPYPQAGAEIMSTAGHMIAITHARACGEFLNKINRQLTTASTPTGDKPELNLQG
jgi:pimeloyl-ACP methyl ester carboxylesterase